MAAASQAQGSGATGGLIWRSVEQHPEERVKEYEEGIKEGGIVMGVNPRTDEDADYFENEWKNYKGEQIYRY